jgi:hypothetical protein
MSDVLAPAGSLAPCASAWKWRPSLQVCGTGIADQYWPHHQCYVNQAHAPAHGSHRVISKRDPNVILRDIREIAEPGQTSKGQGRQGGDHEVRVCTCNPVQPSRPSLGWNQLHNYVAPPTWDCYGVQYGNCAQQHNNQRKSQRDWAYGNWCSEHNEPWNDHRDHGSFRLG